MLPDEDTFAAAMAALQIEPGGGGMMVADGRCWKPPWIIHEGILKIQIHIHWYTWIIDDCRLMISISRAFSCLFMSIEVSFDFINIQWWAEEAFPNYMIVHGCSFPPRWLVARGFPHLTNQQVIIKDYSKWIPNSGWSRIPRFFVNPTLVSWCSEDSWKLWACCGFFLPKFDPCPAKCFTLWWEGTTVHPCMLKICFHWRWSI